MSVRCGRLYEKLLDGRDPGLYPVFRGSGGEDEADTGAPWCNYIVKSKAAANPYYPAFGGITITAGPYRIGDDRDYPDGGMSTDIPMTLDKYEEWRTRMMRCGCQVEGHPHYPPHGPQNRHAHATCRPETYRCALREVLR